MKIKTTNIGEVDTNNMPDLQAELAEKIQTDDLKGFIKERKGSMFLWADVPGKDSWSSWTFFDFEGFMRVVMGISKILSTITKGKYGLVVAPVETIDMLREMQKNSNQKPEDGLNEGGGFGDGLD